MAEKSETCVAAEVFAGDLLLEDLFAEFLRVFALPEEGRFVRLFPLVAIYTSLQLCAQILVYQKKEILRTVNLFVFIRSISFNKNEVGED